MQRRWMPAMPALIPGDRRDRRDRCSRTAPPAPIAPVQLLRQGLLESLMVAGSNENSQVMQALTAEMPAGTSR